MSSTGDEPGIKLRRRSGYAAIPNAVIVDTRISPEARLFLSYLMSCSENWVFYRSHSLKILGCGVEKYQRIVRELKTVGYLVIQSKRGKSGRLEGQEWEIVDNPEPQDAGDQSGNVPQDGGKGGSDREPENPVPGEPSHREPEKPARRLNPAAGKSGPLRRTTKKETKQISCAELTAPCAALPALSSDLDDLVSEFLDAFPKQGPKKATRRAIGKALAAGATTQEILGAAKAYAESQKGNDLKWVRRSDRFFEDEFWHGYRPAVAASSAANDAEFAKVWSETIQEVAAGGKSFMKGRISRDTCLICLRLGSVTAAQCRAAGADISDEEAQAMLASAA